MRELTNLRVAVLVTDGFEEAELVEPVQALKAAGATVEILSTKQEQIQAFRHHDKASTVFAEGWVDQEVVVDGNWVTSRQPNDIPAFNREMLELFSQATPAAQATGVY